MSNTWSSKLTISGVNYLIRKLERMGLGIQYIVIQADDVWRCEEEVKILERLGKPETLIILVSIPN